MHKSLGEIKPIDKNVQLAQKNKLTRANFIVGKSPQFYGTTQKSAFYPMRTQAYSQDQRKVAVDNNRRTNFIGQAGSFESPQKKFDFAGVPDKGVADQSQVKSMIDNLRREHFKLGEKDSMKFNSSSAIGQGAKNARPTERVPWASMKTNYELGTDQIPKATDYANRFAQTQNAFRSGSVNSPFDESKKNKAKMTSDSIRIAGNDRFDTTVNSKLAFKDTLSASRRINTGLDKLTQSYISGSHFKPGYGGFNG